MRIGVVYCEGWDPVRRAVVGPLSPDLAQRRDEAGEQYAVLLFTGDRVHALFEVAWSHRACVAWGFDDQQRRVVKQDFRRLDDQLLLVEQVSWQYPSADTAEFGTSARRTTARHRSRQPAGTLEITDGHPGHPPASRLVPVDLDRLYLGAPSFGDWAGLAFMGVNQIQVATGNPSVREFVAALAVAGHASPWMLHPLLPLDLPADTPFEAHYPPPESVAVVPFDAPVWQPPQPMRPGPRLLAAHPAFGAAVPGGAGRPADVASTDGPVGSGSAVDRGGEMLRLESRTVGMLRLPTGELVVCDPYRVADAQPYTARVPPGQYPVVLSVVGGDDPARGRVAAAWLLIGEAAATSWELATRLGEDAGTLPDGDAFFFGVDAGLACFVDRAGQDGLARLGESGGRLSDGIEAQGVRVVEVEDPVSGANLIAFSSGWGDGAYPVWIGRAADGGIACFMADMLALGNGDDASASKPDAETSMFGVGNSVVLADGPFASLPGTVNAIDVDRRVLKVAVSLFGASVEVEAPFDQVERR